MANSFNYVDWLSAETLRLLLNKLQVAQYFNTDYNSEFEKSFAVGETVRVNYPQRFTVRDGMGYTPQGINRINTTIVCDQFFGIDFEWDSAEQALKMERGMDKIRKEYLEPAAAQLAQEWDSRAAKFAYQNCNNIVGVLGTDPSSFQTMNQARQRMVEKACPPGGAKAMIIPPSVNTSLVNAAVSYFNPADAISKQYKEGSIGRNSGFDWYESMSLYSHTAGTWSGAVSLASAVTTQGATSLSVTCTTGDTFKKGDVIGIASCYAVNPSTRRRTTTATTMQVVVTQDVTGAASAATVQIYPPLYGPGSQYQNVDALPAASATLTLFPGTSSPNGKSGIQGLAIHEQAFALVGVKLESPKATEVTSQTRDPETGIAVRFVRMFDPQQSKMINRFDTLGGFGVLYGDNCCTRVLCA